MNLRLNIFALTLGLFGLTNIELTAQNNVADEVVWMVGDEHILKSDIEYQKLRMLSEGNRVSKDAECFIPEQIAVQKLFLNQAKIDSITVDENQVSRYVELWLQNVIGQVGGQDKLEEYFGKKISQIREDETKEARNGEIVRAMQRKIVENLQVSPSEIREFYAKQNPDSIPFVPEAIEVQMISFRPKVDIAEADRIKSKLREIAEEVKSGKRDFSTAARLYSEDSRTSIQGGEYGYVSRPSLDPQFAQTVFNLTEKKPLSSVVQTASGYHLVQLIDKRGEMVNFRQILMRPKIDDKAIADATSKLDSLSNMIKSNDITFEQAAEFYSSDEDSRNAGGLLTNKKEDSQFAGSSSFQYQELPQELAKVAYELKEGEISAPFLMHNSKGIEEIAIIKLKKIHRGHRANINEDYTLIKNLATNQKREQYIDEWIREHQAKTFIEINANYRDCNFKYPNWIHDNKK